MGVESPTPEDDARSAFVVRVNSTVKPLVIAKAPSNLGAGSPASEPRVCAAPVARGTDGQRLRRR
jgi:hypothetical protein